MEMLFLVVAFDLVAFIVKKTGIVESQTLPFGYLQDLTSFT
jgi:hypothetical protein